ncbi:MAG: GNAT family N-acetyltransferase [Stappiaceae bacterium]
MGDDINVLRVGPQESDRLMAFVRTVLVSDGLAPESDQEKAIEQLLLTPTLGRAWLLTRGEEDLGYALAIFSHSIDEGGPVAMLNDLHLREGTRSHGLGQKLFDGLEKDLRDSGIVAVSLKSSSASSTSKWLYGRLGYAQSKHVFFEKRLKPKETTVEVAKNSGARRLILRKPGMSFPPKRADDK